MNIAEHFKERCDAIADDDPNRDELENVLIHDIDSAKVEEKKTRFFGGMIFAFKDGSAISYGFIDSMFFEGSAAFSTSA